MTRKHLGCIIAPIAVVGLFFVFMRYLHPTCCHDCMVCESNMTRLHFALDRYAEDHDGHHPERVDDLHPRYADLTKLRCPMWKASGGSLETGYEYIPGATRDDKGNRPILFCKRYHLNGHGPGSYEALFCVLAKCGAIVHVENDDLRKYNGPMRRYFLFFRRYPYDGSVPQLGTVRALGNKYPEEFTGGWARVPEDEAGKKEAPARSEPE